MRRTASGEILNRCARPGTSYVSESDACNARRPDMAEGERRLRGSQYPGFALSEPVHLRKAGVFVVKEVSKSKSCGPVDDEDDDLCASLCLTTSLSRRQSGRCFQSGLDLGDCTASDESFLDLGRTRESYVCVEYETRMGPVRGTVLCEHEQQSSENLLDRLVLMTLAGKSRRTREMAAVDELGAWKEYCKNRILSENTRITELHTTILCHAIFLHLPAHEPIRRAQEHSDYPASYSSGSKIVAMSINDIILLIIAVILPPLPVAIKRGACSGALWLNLLLFILAYIPGVIHAWYIILKHPEVVQCNHQADLERNPITGTFPGQVYQPVPDSDAAAIVAHRHITSGNMGGVYGHVQSGDSKGQTASYGTVEGSSSRPPAYSITPDNAPQHVVDAKRT